MLIYENKLANKDSAKATRETIGSPILYLSLENDKRFDVFLSTAIRSHILAPSLNRFVAKMLFEDDYF